MKNSFDLLSEGNQIFDCMGFSWKDHVEFVVKVFVGFVFAFLYFLKQIKHE